MGQYPLSYQTLDRAQLRHRLREPPLELQAVRQSRPSCAPERVAETEGDTERVEVMGVWKSRNGRLNLMDVVKAGPKGTWSSEVQSQVIWESVQDAAGNFDLAKLQEAIVEVHEDLDKLRGLKKAGLRKEELSGSPYRFHYYPDGPTLQLTLEQLQVQRKMVLWGVAPRARHQEHDPRQAVGRRGLGRRRRRPPPPLRWRSSVALARERRRGNLQGHPARRSWVAALRRYCCCCCSSQGKEGEEEEEEGGRD